MDNCAIHDKRRLRAMCAREGVLIEFIPAYSPQYNPIECAWLKYKTWLKTNRAYVSTLDSYDAIRKALSTISPQDCENWVRAVAIFDT